MTHVRIATRRSPLARTQTEIVAAHLRETGVDVSIVELVTTGDRWSAGGARATRGLFVKELEEALLDGRADIAVHSAKDLPADLPEGLAILAIPEREDPRDVVVAPGAGTQSLPAGARIGTGSPRRVAQLQLAYPALDFREIRGNVGTRIDMIDRGDVDAVVLAAAGLNRLGLTGGHIVTPLEIDVCVPAPGQGALAIEGRSDDDDLREILAGIADPATERCVALERAVLTGLGGGCREPIGALARAHDDGVTLDVFAADSSFTRHSRHRRDLAGDDDLADLVRLVREDLTLHDG